MAAEAGVDCRPWLELRNHVINHNVAFSGPGWASGNKRRCLLRPVARACAPCSAGHVDPLRLPAAFNNQINPDSGRALSRTTMAAPSPLTALPSRNGEGNTTLCATRVYVDVPDSDTVTTQTTPPVPADQTLAQPAAGYPARGPRGPVHQPARRRVQNDQDTLRTAQVNHVPLVVAHPLRSGYSPASVAPLDPAPMAGTRWLRRFSFFTDWRNGAIPWLPVASPPPPPSPRFQPRR